MQKRINERNQKLLKNLELHYLINIHQYYKEQGKEFKNIELLLKVIIDYYNYALESFVLYRGCFDEYIEFINNCPNNKGEIELQGDLIDEEEKIQN